MKSSRHITELKIKNVLRIRAVHITPSGNVVTITGKNEAGKSSVLRSIWMALGGKDSVPPKPVHEGAESGVTEVRFGELIVKRSFTETGTYLTVSTADGARYQGPQQLLDRLLGQRTIDPTAFLGQDAKQQRDTLRSLVGLDFSKLEEERESVYSGRREVNRTVKSLEAELGAMTRHELPEKLPDPAAIEQEIQEATKKNEGRAPLVQDQVNANNQLERANSLLREVGEKRQEKATRVEELEKAIATLKGEITELDSRLSKGRAVVDQVRADLQTATAAVDAFKAIDVQPLVAKLAGAHEVANKHRENQLRQRKADELTKQLAEADRMTSRLAAIEQEKTSLIKGAKYPIEGLSMSDDGVTYKGFPLEQASDAIRIRVCVAIASAMASDIRVLLIRQGSFFDRSNLKLLHDEAKANDLQVWIERVEDDDPGAVVIEDGTVKGAPAEEDKTLD